MGSQLIVVHGDDNVEVVKTSVASLDKAGISCWSPYLDLGFSRDPHADVQTAIDGSLGLLLIVGASGEASEDIRQVLSYAQSKGKVCFLGSTSGIPKGDLGSVLWEEVCNVEGGQVEPIVRALSTAPLFLPTATIPSLEPQHAAYPRYDSPLHSSPVAGRIEEYVSLRSRSVWVKVFMAFPIFAFALSALTYLKATGAALSTSFISRSEGDSIRATFLTGTLLTFAAYFLIAVSLFPFLMWIYRGRKNLQSFGVKGVEFSDGFAVVAFLVPLINLVLPMVVMSSLGKASMPLPREDDSASWKGNKTPPTLVLWLAASYLPAFVLNFIVRAQTAGTVTESHFASYLLLINVISNSFYVVAGVSLWMFVEQVTKMQDERLDGMALAMSRRTVHQSTLIPQARLGSYG